MSNKKPLEIDMIAGSQLRDSQGEMLSIEGADISDLENGVGRINDNHSKGFTNFLGRVTTAKKIFNLEDCEDDRHRYYWEKVKSPFIYAKAVLFDNDDHPNSRATAAILRNIHKSDCPLKVKCSVEGGTIARGIKDPTLLARTKIHSIALTMTPANNATLVEPLNLEKSDSNWESDLTLIKSVMHLAKTDVPNFRHIERHASADKISENLQKINNTVRQLGLKTSVPEFSIDELMQQALEAKIADNVKKINNISKSLSAGYGGAGAPGSMTGGAVIQSEALDDGRHIGGTGFKYIRCNHCGKEQPYAKNQVRCRGDGCGKGFSLEELYPLLVKQ